MALLPTVVQDAATKDVPHGSVDERRKLSQNTRDKGNVVPGLVLVRSYGIRAVRVVMYSMW